MTTSPYDPRNATNMIVDVPAKDLAIIIATLVREGIIFRARPNEAGLYEITLTGGY